MDIRKDILNEGLRRDLSRNFPILSRLETFPGFINLQLTSVDSTNLERDLNLKAKGRMQVGYEAEAIPEVYKALKKSLVRAGVLVGNYPITQTYSPFLGKKHMRMYFFKEALEVDLRVFRSSTS